MSGSNLAQKELWAPVRFVLTDRNGPVAGFPSWEEASEYMSRNQGSGWLIVRRVEPAAEAAPSPGAD
jgi:hypothetical protein